jgi:carboxymethylenebutenolidase
VLDEGSADRERMRAVRTKMTIPPVMDDIGATTSRPRSATGSG